jgi:hypothetical protein
MQQSAASSVKKAKKSSTQPDKNNKNNNVAGFDNTAMFVQRIFGHAPIKIKKNGVMVMSSKLVDKSGCAALSGDRTRVP